ncbi:glycerol-3-phosphate dehydrogenase [Marinitoga hydrogenitolerans DSM 16785]|uniref:Glycerol-3-phosphate dehydrogenase n=1 Tax=Marinitoga hydrogenitolerans (strain DSM 16785 / JCM 12826 / AT1271) TaxID=1122195 RepID=A0A1M4XAE2_MARH1|nr:NAD(P)/FAD-dependent oxidoreductase [Marinitoga hydrogenitolerans]SHE90401.1 glycerol-3-phosphate dehydrogenase [Marinitoga hydrogenitolerans DSM 16785]
MYDITIIGAGVVGCAIARELSKYDLKILLLEKTDDVSNGASKANSGIVHGGYAAKHGTLKSKLCFEGNKMYDQLNNELNFGFKRTGALVLGFDEEDEKNINKLYENGLKNGVDKKDIKIIYKDEILNLEPNVSKNVKIALLANDVGITSPYEMTIALAENAIKNGVELKLENEVINIEEFSDYFNIITTQNTYKSRYIINAAGVYSDKISNMLGINDFHIIPRKGQYIIFHKGYGKIINRVIFQTPTNKGKGILVTPTFHGNLMIGPNADEISNKEDVTTDIETLKYIIKTAKKSVPNIDLRKVLTSFSGIRPTPSTGDFIIKEAKERFINVAGIESPGLTSSPAIAKMVIGILKNSGLNLTKKNDFDPYRNPIIIPKKLSYKEVNKMLEINSDEQIICRCEMVSKKEIIDALNRGIPIKSIDSVKRRTRVTMGFCQGEFCIPRVKKVIAETLNIKEDDVPVREKKSGILPKKVNLNYFKSIFDNKLQ